jgi:hypothetical protein
MQIMTANLAISPEGYDSLDFFLVLKSLSRPKTK